jgi:hypothetical protein
VIFEESWFLFQIYFFNFFSHFFYDLNEHIFVPNYEYKSTHKKTKDKNNKNMQKLERAAECDGERLEEGGRWKKRRTRRR